MIRAIAIVPQPPLLVPELVGAAAAEVEPLRTACQQAVRRLGTPRWYALGVDDAGPVHVPPTAHGSFHGYGVDVPVSLTAAQPLPAEPAGPVPLPLSLSLSLPLLVAGWLREHAGAHAVTGELVHPSTAAMDCLIRGKELAGELNRDQATQWAMLVLADGACAHAVPGAGRVDDWAPGFGTALDTVLAAALATADAEALAAIDPEQAAALGLHSRAAWQVLAGIVIGSESRWAGELLYSAAPYGVGYHVAVWEQACQ